MFGRSFDSLDVLAALGKRARLLTLVPVAVAGLTYLATLLLPPLFLSETYLKLDENSARAAEVLIRSPAVLGKIAAKDGVSAGDLERRISFYVPPRETRKTSSLVILGFEAATPAAAQTTNKAIVDVWLAETKPKPDARAFLEARLERTKAQLASIGETLGRLQSEAPSLLVPGSLQGELATPIVNLVNQRAEAAANVADLERQLAGVSRDVVVVPATLPVNRSWPARSLIAILAALTSLFASLVFVLLQAAMASITDKEKLKRVRQAWAFLPFVRDKSRA